MSKLFITKDNMLDLCGKYIFVISKNEFGVSPKRIYAINKYGVVRDDNSMYYWNHIKEDEFDYYVCDSWLNNYASREMLDKYAQLIVDVQID